MPLKIKVEINDIENQEFKLKNVNFYDTEALSSIRMVKLPTYL